MAFCQNCGNDIPDGVMFCANCGTPVGGADKPQVNNVVNVVPEYDHTMEFDIEDIKANKVFAMISMLCGVLGAVVTFIGAKDSAYAMFYAKESLKATVLAMLISIISSVLMFTFIVPIAGGVCAVIIVVCRIIAFFTICQNMAKEIPIVRAFTFLSK